MTLLEAAQHVLDESVAAGIPLDGYNSAHYSRAGNAAIAIELHLSDRTNSELVYVDCSYHEHQVKNYLLKRKFTVEKIKPSVSDPLFYETYSAPGSNPIWYITYGKYRMVLIMEKDAETRRGSCNPSCRTVSDKKIRNDVYLKMLYLFGRCMRDPLNFLERGCPYSEYLR